MANKIPYNFGGFPQKFVVVIGGEHSVSIGTIKAHSEFFNQISILHLDAHSDRRDS